MSVEELKVELRKMLIKNAIDCTYYVGFGTANANDFAERSGLPLTVVKDHLAVAATQLVSELQALPK